MEVELQIWVQLGDAVEKNWIGEYADVSDLKQAILEKFPGAFGRMHVEDVTQFSLIWDPAPDQVTLPNDCKDERGHLFGDFTLMELTMTKENTRRRGGSPVIVHLDEKMIDFQKEKKNILNSICVDDMYELSIRDDWEKSVLLACEEMEFGPRVTTSILDMFKEEINQIKADTYVYTGDVPTLQHWNIDDVLEDVENEQRTFYFLAFGLAEKLLLSDAGMTGLSILNYPWKRLTGKTKMKKIREHIETVEKDGLYAEVIKLMFETTPTFKLLPHIKMGGCEAFTITNKKEISLNKNIAFYAQRQTSESKFFECIAYFAITIVHECGHLKLHGFAPESELYENPSTRKQKISPQKLMKESGEFLETEIYGHVAVVDVDDSTNQLKLKGPFGIEYETDYFNYVVSETPSESCYIPLDSIKRKSRKCCS